MNNYGYISYPMFIEPTITWVSLGFSGYIWLVTKIVLKKSTWDATSPFMNPSVTPNATHIIELHPRPCLQTLKGWFLESAAWPLLTWHLMTFFFPVFTLIPFNSMTFFHFSNFSISKSSVSATKTNHLHIGNLLNSLEKASITMINNNGQKTKP